MIEVLIATVVLGGIAAGVAALLRKRSTDVPDQGAEWQVPTFLDRDDFERPDTDWLVAVFASETCLACNGTWDKAALLESKAVAVQRIDSIADKALHDRYQIDAVPMVLVVDAEGTVGKSFVGEPTATDLWAAVADLREPGSVPPGCH